MIQNDWLIYGANGYTGRLVVEQAVKQGHNPVIAGRSPEKIKPIAEQYDLPYLILNLNDKNSVSEKLSNFKLISNFAGPYPLTVGPLADVCIENGIHYIDVSGDLNTIQHILDLDKQAKAKSIVMIPAAGFITYATECLAQYLAEQIENPKYIELGIHITGGTSRGTTISTVDSIKDGCLIRKDHQLMPVKFGKDTKKIMFPDSEHPAWAVPLAELLTVHRALSIPNITVFNVMPPSLNSLRLFATLIQKALKIKTFKSIAKKIAAKQPEGPTREQNFTTKSYIWARTGNSSEEKQAWLETPEAYYFTALLNVRFAEIILESELNGSLASSEAFGKELIFEFDNVRIIDEL